MMDQKGNIIQPVDTDGIVLKRCNKYLNVPLDIQHIDRSRPIGEAKDSKISIIVRFLTYRKTIPSVSTGWIMLPF
jgi:hypothetical protein